MEKSLNKPNKPQNNLLVGKVPPNAKDLEMAVLGAILLDKKAFELVGEVIDEDCFYQANHQKVFRAARDLYEKSMSIDLLTVSNRLLETGDLEEMGGPVYLMELTNRVVSTAHIQDHARIIFEKYLMRELIRVGGEIIGYGYDEGKDAFEAMQDAEKQVFDISGQNIKKDFNHISVGVKKSLEKIEQLQHREHRLTGVPSGFKKIDDITNGWQSTDLIIIAARPSVGKSAFALNLACNAAFNEDKPTCVAVFSLEMSEEQLTNRMLSSETAIPLRWITRGELNDKELERLTTDATTRISEGPIYIDDTSGLSVFELRSKARRLKSKYNLGLLIVDYLQLMEGGSGKKSFNREQEISNISRKLKALAKELEIPVIALSQLSRDVEKRGDGKPRLSDLRESGAIEQDADIVSFIHRPSEEDIKRDAYLVNAGYFRIAKHRNGALGDLDLYVDLSIQKWRDEEPREIKFPTKPQGTLFPTETPNLRPLKIEPYDDEPF